MFHVQVRVVPDQTNKLFDGYLFTPSFVDEIRCGYWLVNLMVHVYCTVYSIFPYSTKVHQQ